MSKDKAAAQQERLAKALRENLKKRKAQVRSRANSASGAPKPAGRLK